MALKRLFIEMMSDKSESISPSDVVKLIPRYYGEVPDFYGYYVGNSFLPEDPANLLMYLLMHLDRQLYVPNTSPPVSFVRQYVFGIFKVTSTCSPIHQCYDESMNIEFENFMLLDCLVGEGENM